MVKKNMAFSLMVVFLGVALLPGVLSTGTVVSATHVSPPSISIDHIHDATGCFIENKGQWDPDILFAGDTDFGRVIFREDQIQYQLIQYEGSTDHEDPADQCLSPLHPDFRSIRDLSIPRLSYQSYAVNLSYPKATPATIEGLEPTGTFFNYFIGDDPTGWASECQAFRQITYTNLWEGIDLSYYFNKDGLKYDFILSPKADASQLNIHIEGAHLLLKEKGTHAKLQTPLGTLMEAPLYTYGASTHKAYPVRFVDATPIKPPHEDALVPASDFYPTSHTSLTSQPLALPSFLPTATLSFTGIPSAPRKEPLVIDPLIRSTYVGGIEFGSISTCIAIGKNDTIYVAGVTYGKDFPKTSGGAQAKNKGLLDGFIAQYSSDLSQMYQATYIGGNEEEFITSIALNSAENLLFVTGQTGSVDFPKTIGGAQSKKRALDRYYWDDYEYIEKDGFISKLSIDLKTLHQSTFLGGPKSSGIEKIVLAKNGSVYVAGHTSSSDFPKIANGAIVNADSELDNFISVLSSDLFNLVQSTFINMDLVNDGLKISNDSMVYVCSSRKIRKFSPDLKKLISESPYFNHSVESFDIAPDNSIFIAGTTDKNNLPKTNGSAQEKKKGDYNGFITHISSNLEDIIISTYLGDGDSDSINGIKLDGKNEIFVVGVSYSRSILSFSDRVLNPKTQISANANHFVASISYNLDKFNQIVYLGEAYPSRKYGLPIIDIKNPRTIYVSCETQSRHIPGLIYGHIKKLPYEGTLYKGYPIGNSFISRVYFPSFDETIIYLQIASSNADLIKEGKKQTIRMDVAPQVIQERTMVPLRFIAEAFGTEVEWIANTKSIRLVKGDTIIIMQIDSRVVYINERKIFIDAPPVVRNARTLAPVRFVAENMGYAVNWFAQTKEIKITQ